jgi:hypothetical protein
MVKPKLKTMQRSHYDKRNVTVIETEHGNRYSEIPEKDFELLMDLYDSLPHPNLHNLNWDFVNDVDSRIYTEWCMCTGWDKHAKYEGEGYTAFVREQTHLELERKGYLWNEQEKRFENLKNNEQYEQSRHRVLGGLALRAIELFSDWNGETSPPSRVEGTGSAIRCIYDDWRNLRCSLQDYISRFESLTQQQTH